MAQIGEVLILKATAAKLLERHVRFVLARTISLTSVFFANNYSKTGIGPRSVNGNLAKYNGGYWTNYDSKNGFDESRITCLTVSPQGEVWFGGWGVWRIAPNVQKMFSASDSGLISNYVNDLAFSNQNHIFIATNQGLSSTSAPKAAVHTTIAGARSNGLDIMVLNNPVQHGSLMARIRATQAGATTIQIFDNAGKGYSLYNELCNAGETNLSFKIPDLSSGAYTLMVQQGDMFNEAKFVIQR
jgi:hypothetical protein